jgi:hypothetical protein
VHTTKAEVGRLLNENVKEDVRLAIYANQGILTYFKVKDRKMAMHLISDVLLGVTVLELDGTFTEMVCKVAELNPTISEYPVSL